MMGWERDGHGIARHGMEMGKGERIREGMAVPNASRKLEMMFYVIQSIGRNLYSTIIRVQTKALCDKHPPLGHPE
jgi:hypothetical protein